MIAKLNDSQIDVHVNLVLKPFAATVFEVSFFVVC